MLLLRAEWWEAHQPLVVFMWIILLVVPFAIVYGAGDTFETVLECIVNDYLTFIVLLFVFYHLDKKAYRKDIAEGRKPDISRPGTEFYIEGLHNIILLAAFLSFKTTDSSIRTKNHFTWGAIKEVAVLFIGIFITMQPALMLLKSVGPNLGISEPYQMFWATGALSSFLDNTPTYLVFLTTAGTLGLTGGITTALGQIPVNLLEAISCGAVFMGANIYIGNAPNFMVKAISDENGVNMPSFFGYILWSLAFLVPVFILAMLVLFLWEVTDMANNKDLFIELSNRIYDLDGEVYKCVGSSLGRTFTGSRENTIRALSMLMYTKPDGHLLRSELADKLHINYYDSEIFEQVLKRQEEEKFHIKEKECFTEFDKYGKKRETLKSKLRNTYRYHGLNREDAIFFHMSDLICNLARTEDCIIVGRCADIILRNNYIPHISLFISAPFEMRLHYMMNVREMDQKTAVKFLKKMDRQHKKYYEFYTSEKWGTPENCDLCINSANYGIKETIEIIERLIINRKKA